MNPADYYALQMQLTEVVNGLFQIWLGFTFATIVAFHFGNTKMTGILVVFVEILYLGASVVFAGYYFNMGVVSIHYNNMLVEAGYAPHPSPGSLVVFGLFALYAFGTIGTCAYGIYIHRKQKRIGM
ncbi:MAG: hypothetical protein GKR90_27230 [Pseudomonadales bacterium]|nr:hypothetical protein [Pseudomonadales bacterium]